MTYTSLLFGSVFLLGAVYSAVLDHLNGSKIAGGSLAALGQFPYQVLIEFAPTGLPLCGGSILNEEYILTAAHCFIVNDRTIAVDNVIVWAGGIAFEESQITGQKVWGEKILMNNYDEITKDNDIALLKLESKLVFGVEENVNKIDLIEERIDAGQECTMSGWGYTNESGIELPYWPDLRYVDVLTVDRDTCQEAYNFLKFKLTDNMICAGSRTTHKDACKGDDGGPLVHEGKQIGVMSFGVGCGRSWVKYPGVYTDVTNYLDWINRMINS